MPKAPNPKDKILYYVNKIDDLQLNACLLQETEEQKLLNMQWRAKMTKNTNLLAFWQKKLNERYN